MAPRPPATRCLCPPRTRGGAFTLVELLVSVSVIAILMMAGVGLYWRMSRGFALQAATSSIEAALRAARAFAIHDHAPAMVVAVPQRDDEEGKLIGVVYPLGRQTVSCWHFEADQFAGTKVMGALGQEGNLPGDANHVRGKVGRAFLLDGNDSMEVSSPYLDGLREGVFLDAYVYPDDTGLDPDDLLPVACKDVRASASYALDLIYDGDGLFAVDARVRVDASGGTQEVAADTDAVVPANTWSHVAMAYVRNGQDAGGNTRGLLIVSVNGEEAGRQEEAIDGTALLTPNTEKLHIGTDGTSYFRGRLDELKVAGLVAGEVQKLPKNTEVTLDAGESPDGRVHFDAEGKLDPRHHTRAVLFRVISEEDRLLRVVRVNWLGSVEVFETDPPED